MPGAGPESSTRTGPKGGKPPFATNLLNPPGKAREALTISIVAWGKGRGKDPVGGGRKGAFFPREEKKGLFRWGKRVDPPGGKIKMPPLSLWKEDSFCTEEARKRAVAFS